MPTPDRARIPASPLAGEERDLVPPSRRCRRAPRRWRGLGDRQLGVLERLSVGLDRLTKRAQRLADHRQLSSTAGRSNRTLSAGSRFRCRSLLTRHSAPRGTPFHRRPRVATRVPGRKRRCFRRLRFPTASVPNTAFGAVTTICGTTPHEAVARRGGLPGLPALVPGLRRRRRRRPGRHREPAGPYRGLGADALWLSPVYPVAGGGLRLRRLRLHGAVDPVFGDARGLRPAGRIRPRPRPAAADGPGALPHLDRASVVHRAPRLVRVGATAGRRPPNNWLATFGGPAWTRDERSGRWYLHSFYPEQPDLDWRNPEVVAAMQDVVRFWLTRGVDGFRIDAIDRLVKDPQLRDDPPATAPFGLPLPEEYGRLDHSTPRNSPDIRHALGALREAAGRRPAGGRGLPARGARRPIWSTSTRSSPSSCFTPRGRPARCARPSRRAPGGRRRVGAVQPRLLPHRAPLRARRTRAPRRCCCSRFPARRSSTRERRSGQVDGPGPGTAVRPRGPRPLRHPVQWEPEPHRPGLPPATRGWRRSTPRERSVAAQSGDPDSLLALYRRADRAAAALAGGPGAARRRRRASSRTRAASTRRGREHHPPTSGCRAEGATVLSRPTRALRRARSPLTAPPCGRVDSVVTTAGGV